MRANAQVDWVLEVKVMQCSYTVFAQMCGVGEWVECVSRHACRKIHNGCPYYTPPFTGRFLYFIAWSNSEPWKREYEMLARARSLIRFLSRSPSISSIRYRVISSASCYRRTGNEFQSTSSFYSESHSQKFSFAFSFPWSSAPLLIIQGE